MLYGLYLSAAGLQAQERKQDVIANNLANANVNGFKRDLAMVQARANAVNEDPAMAAYRVSMLENQGGGVSLMSGGMDLTQGALQKSTSPTDLALDGPGFFVLQGDAGGKPILTRDGNFQVNNSGTLVQAASRRAVLGADGEPIKLNPDSNVAVTVDKNGTITQGNDGAAQLKLVDVTDSRRLIKLGGNTMTVDDEQVITAAKTSTLVRSGSLEQSGVNPIVEMVNMMTGQRIFDANAKMISMQDTTLQLLNGVGRVA